MREGATLAARPLLAEVFQRRPYLVRLLLDAHGVQEPLHHRHGQGVLRVLQHLDLVSDRREPPLRDGSLDLLVEPEPVGVPELLGDEVVGRHRVRHQPRKVRPLIGNVAVHGSINRCGVLQGPHDVPRVPRLVEHGHVIGHAIERSERGPAAHAPARVYPRLRQGHAPGEQRFLEPVHAEMLLLNAWRAERGEHLAHLGRA